MKVTGVTNGGESMFVSTGASAEHYVSGTSEPNKTISASINIRDTTPSVMATETSESFDVSYDIRQTLVAQSGFTAQDAAILSAGNTASITLLGSFSAVEDLGAVHVWESGIATNEIIKAVDTTNTDAIQFDDLTGTELDGKLTIEHSGGKLQMRALAPWDKIDSGRCRRQGGAHHYLRPVLQYRHLLQVWRGPLHHRRGGQQVVHEHPRYGQRPRP